jgi:hypothetical protein
MSHVEKFAQKAVKMEISSKFGMLKPYKDPKFLEICVYEENDKSCLIAVRVEATQKASGRRVETVGFQVWRSIFGAWISEQPGTKLYTSYLSNNRGIVLDSLYDRWYDEEYKRTISEI